MPEIGRLMHKQLKTPGQKNEQTRRAMITKKRLYDSLEVQSNHKQAIRLLSLANSQIVDRDRMTGWENLASLNADFNDTISEALFLANVYFMEGGWKTRKFY